ncbi:MAG: hypothetical protein ACQKBV_08045, partial [Puniceicoccales bacterium]
MKQKSLSWFRLRNVSALATLAFTAGFSHTVSAQFNDTDLSDNVTAGDQFGAAIDGNGSLRTWGLNTSGQLGQGNTNSPQALPQEVSDNFSYVAVEAGPDFMFGI